MRGEGQQSCNGKYPAEKVNENVMLCHWAHQTGGGMAFGLSCVDEWIAVVELVYVC